MKLFAKEFKKIAVDKYLFICVIDHNPENEFISFKIYPADKKSSYYLILFSWEINWISNLCEPRICTKLIRHAIDNGWDFTNKHAVITLKNGDILINQLGLDE